MCARRADPVNSEIKVCPGCGESFTRLKSRPEKYCSHECREQAKAERRAETTCPTCGKPFTYLKSWPRVHCSNVCAGKANVTNIPGFVANRFTATCEQCGKGYETTPKATRGRFCSQRCWGDWLAANQRGEAHPNRGKEFGRAKHLPPPSTIQCPICDTVFVVKPREVARRRCCSMKCYGEWMANNGLINGANNPNWKGGAIPDYYGPTWHEARRAVRQRDQVCIGCGVGPDELGRELDVHHLTPFRDFGFDRHAEANRLDNLVALCPACHKRWEHSGRRP